jgi:hypothetical protein
MYGLVTPVERIRDYNRYMDADWWQRKGLGRWVRHYIRSMGIADVYCFFSATYRASIGGVDFGKGVRTHYTPFRNLGSLTRQGELLRHLAVDGVCRCQSLCGGGPA